MPINAEWIDIRINARILIGIDRHWTLIEGVLRYVWHYQVQMFYCILITQQSI